MNRTKIEWTQWTWNPVTGCSRGCEYCYARRMAYRLRGRSGYPRDDPFRPTFHPDRLEEPLRLKRPSLIFVCSMGELFDPRGRPEWIEQVLTVIEQCPQHVFQILTKRPHIASRYSFPANVWLGVSYEGQAEVARDDPWVSREAQLESLFYHLSQCDAGVRFASFEPLLGPVPSRVLPNLDWVIIGAQTGPRARPPKREWVRDVIVWCRLMGIPVFLKDNLRWPMTIREWPRIERPLISSGTTGADRALERGLPSSYLDSYLDGKRGGGERGVSTGDRGGCPLMGGPSLIRRMEEEIRRRHQREMEEWLFGRPAVTWRVPRDAPCNNCIQRVGSGIYRSRCTYWPKLQQMAREGRLEAIESGENGEEQ